MRRPATLRHRLALVALLTTAAWVAALTVLFNVALSNQLRHQADDVLRTRAQAALSTVDVSAGGTLTVRETANDAALDAGIWVYQGSEAIDRAAITQGDCRYAVAADQQLELALHMEDGALGRFARSHRLFAREAAAE